jgi:hypothetical protein
MADLTPDEVSFFETGELPESLVPAEEPPEPEVKTAETVVEEPKVEPARQTVSPLDLEEFREAQRQMNERYAQMLARLEEENKPKPAAAPDEETDPLGAIFHKLDTVNNEVTTLKQQLAESENKNAIKNEIDQFTNNVRALKEDFIKTTPDFDAAYNHIRSVRTEDLLATGVPKSDIHQMLLQDEIRLASASLQRGKNPAAEMYEMAKRYGYTAKAADGKPASVAKPAPVGETADQKVERLKNGQFAARQPARAGTEVDLTLGGLSEASDGDLNKIIGNDNDWARIVGGKAGNDVLH